MMVFVILRSADHTDMFSNVCFSEQFDFKILIIATKNENKKIKTINSWA